MSDSKTMLEVLVRAHQERVRDGATLQELAAMEAELWRSEGRRLFTGRLGPNDSHEWLCKHLGGKTTAYAVKALLHNAGPDAQILWDKIQRRELGLYTARRVMAEARKVAREKHLRLSEAIMEGLARNEAKPHEIKVNGIAVKVSAASRFNGDGRVSKSRGFWATITDQIKDHLRQAHPELDDLEMAPILQQVSADLAIMSTEVRNKVGRLSMVKKKEAQDDGVAAKMVSRHSLAKACAILRMDPPKPNSLVDLALANRKRRQLAKLYHPDARGGDTSLLSAYQELMNAYSVLERYNEQLNQPGDENHDR